MEQLDNHWMGFQWNLLFGSSPNICLYSPVGVKIGHE
jgi:hypothetical protein